MSGKMICYSNREADRIQAEVATRLGRKVLSLDLFCKVTPNVGKPYFLPTKHTEEVAEAVKVLGIQGKIILPPAPQVRKLGGNGSRLRFFNK
jgi:hypothetical protein